MATTAQLNAAVDAARNYAFAEIKEKVPGFFQSEADNYVTNAELLAAVKVIVAAYEKAAPPKLTKENP
jgi:hypothetical protein